MIYHLCHSFHGKLVKTAKTSGPLHCHSISSGKHCNKDVYSEDERGSSLEMVSSVLAAIAFTVTEILLLSIALDYPE